MWASQWQNLHCKERLCLGLGLEACIAWTICSSCLSCYIWVPSLPMMLLL